jgi:MFS family permease
MKNILALLFIIVTAGFLYLFTLHGVTGNPKGSDIKNNLDQASKPLELSPERGRYVLLLSLDQDQSFALNKELGEAAAPDVGFYNGNYYVFFAPGISILSLPLYVLGKSFDLGQVFAFATIALFAILNMICIFAITNKIFKLPIWGSLLAAFIFGFATSSWSYAVTLYQHHVTTFFILSAFFAVWKYRERKWTGFLWASYVWISYGLALAVDYPNAVLLLPVIVYFFLSSISLQKLQENLQLGFRPVFIATSIFFIAISILHGYYNYVNFGDWKKLSGSLVGYKNLQELKLLDDSQAQEKIKKIEQSKEPFQHFKEERFPSGLNTLFTSLDKGILIFSPIVLLGIFGLVRSFTPITIEKGILLATILINIFVYSTFSDPWGGWAFGPRYLIPSMALFAIFTGIFLTQMKHQILGKFVALILITYSSAIALLGVLTTNAVPPKIEADYLGMKYNFLLNFDFLQDGRSASFIYNVFFSSFFSLIQYFLILHGILMLIFTTILFIIPRLEKNYVR